MSLHNGLLSGIWHALRYPARSDTKNEATKSFGGLTRSYRAAYPRNTLDKVGLRIGPLLRPCASSGPVHERCAFPLLPLGLQLCAQGKA